MKTEDQIIERYLSHLKSGVAAETKEFKQLSQQFHEVFRLCVARAKLKGWLISANDKDVDASRKADNVGM